MCAYSFIRIELRSELYSYPTSVRIQLPGSYIFAGICKLMAFTLSSPVAVCVGMVHKISNRHANMSV